MIRSLAVILIPLVIITVLFTDLPKDAQVAEVDWTPVLVTAREQAPFPVLAPTNLPPGWRATRVSWVRAGEPVLNGQASARNQWELGILTADDLYLGLAQGDLRPDDLVKEETRAGRPDGESAVGGQTWERRVSSDERTYSLVLREPEVTTIVSGDVDYSALEAYASTLANR